MKHKKIIAFLLMMAFLLSNMTVPAVAAENAGIAVKVSSETVEAGDQVTVTVSLTGYDVEAVPIRGIQIDVTGVDETILTVEDGSYVSLIEDPSATSNKAVYQQANQLLRLIYVRMDGTLAQPYEDVFQMTFLVNSKLEEAGSITLPLTAKLQTTESRVTINDEITIAYVPASEEPEIVNVDVTWGAMEFVYTDGVWNTEKHIYEGAGWTDNRTGYVTVKNSGTVETSARFFYITDRTDISGVFNVETVPVLEAGGEVTARLTLNGKPEKALSEKTVIGSVTVQIGGE